MSGRPLKFGKSKYQRHRKGRRFKMAAELKKTKPKAAVSRVLSPTVVIARLKGRT